MQEAAQEAVAGARRVHHVHLQSQARFSKRPDGLAQEPRMTGVALLGMQTSLDKDVSSSCFTDL